MGRHKKGWQPVTKEQEQPQEQQQENKNNIDMQQEQEQPTEQEINSVISDIFESYGNLPKAIEKISDCEISLARIATGYAMLNLKFEQAKNAVKDDERKNSVEIQTLNRRLNELIEENRKLRNRIEKIELTPYVKNHLDLQ